MFSEMALKLDTEIGIFVEIHDLNSHVVLPLNFFVIATNQRRLYSHSKKVN